MPPNVNRMWVRQFRSIGFVDAGACEGANILMIAKRETPAPAPADKGGTVAKAIVKQGDEFCVMDEDGKKVLGRHKTKAKAQAQLAAIDANAAKRAATPNAAPWAVILKSADDTARPVLDATEAAFYDAVQKLEDCVTEPKTFSQIQDTQAVMEETWRIWDRFRDSVRSILQSESADKAALLVTSATEFQAFLVQAAPKWAAGQTAVAKGETMPKPAEKTAAAPTAAPTLTAEARKALAPEVVTYLEHVEAAAKPAEGAVSKADHDAALAAKDTEIAALKGRVAELDPTASDEETLKGLTPAAAEMVKAARKTADDALKLAEDERDKREIGEAVTKAAALAPLGKPDAIGPMLRRIEKGTATPADHLELKRILAAAAESMKRSKDFVALGVDDAPGEGSAVDEVKKRVVEIRKADAKMTESKALIAALDADPELADRYRAEKRPKAH